MNNLRNLRTAKGLSMSQLSRLTNIPIRSIEEYENERQQITYYHRLDALCKALDCSMVELMTKKEKCIYDGDDGDYADIQFIQKEDGVHIEISYIFDAHLCIVEAILPRKKALELINCMKTHGDVKDFLDDLN